MNTPNDLKSQFLTETISSFDVLDEIVSVVENTECVDCLASTVTEELTCIEESYLPKEGIYSVPDITKEQWLKSNELRKGYEEIKEFIRENSLNEDLLRSMHILVENVPEADVIEFKVAEIKNERE